MVVFTRSGEHGTALARERVGGTHRWWGAAAAALVGWVALDTSAAAAARDACPLSVAVAPYAATAAPRFEVRVADGGAADLDAMADGGCETTIRVCLGERGVCAAEPVRSVDVGGSRRSDAGLRIRDALEALPGVTPGPRGTIYVDPATAPADGCAEARVRVPARGLVPIRLSAVPADRGTRARVRVGVRCVEPGAEAATCRASRGACPAPADPPCVDAACRPHGAENVAATATALASSEQSPLSGAASAIDGVVPQRPGHVRHEWISRGETAGAFLRLTWPQPVTLARVVLHDRTSHVDNIRAATLLVDDADPIPVGPLPADGSPAEVMLGARTLLTLTLVVTQADGVAGLAEIAAIAAPPTDPGTPGGGDPATPGGGDPDPDEPGTPPAEGEPTTDPVVTGTTYYIAPGGSDGNPGTSSAPFRTFKKAFEGRRLKPGDALVLLDGTYTRATTGLPRIDCGSSGNARNGTAASPIVVRAKNERRAHLAADGTSDAFEITRCSYWHIQGLRGSNKDVSATKSWDGNVFQVLDSSNLVLKRLLAVHPNKTCGGGYEAGGCNSHAIAMDKSHHVVLEENEVYDYHRHGISAFSSRWITVRRCFIHSRQTGAVGNGGKPTGVILYGSSDSIVENSIAEWAGGFNIAGTKAYDGSAGGYRNKLLGVIGLDGSYGSTIRSRQFGGPVLPTGHNLIKDSVFARMNNTAVFSRGAAETTLDHVTIYGTKIDAGFAADEDPTSGSPCSANPEGCSATVRSTLSFGNKGRGVRIDTRVTRRWSIERSQLASNAGGDFPTSENPADTAGNIRGSIATAPTKMGLGAGQCLLWAPSGSTARGVGESGTAAGATVLYRYENGALTTKPLWNPTTGAFPCGAVVAGVNDVPGRSCRDVHQRLNVHSNGCSFPASYH